MSTTTGRKSKRHTHQYYRAEAPMMGTNIWTCASKDCSHHMPKNYEFSLLHKGFKCWECGEYSTLLEEHLRTNPDPKYFLKNTTELTYPICRDCAEGTVKVKEIDIDEILKIVGEN